MKALLSSEQHILFYKLRFAKWREGGIGDVNKKHWFLQ